MHHKRYRFLASLLNIAIAAVWFINGLFCKVLNLVPRHRAIVAHILGAEHATEITMLIGILEVLMAIWIVSSYKSRLCAVLQVVVVITMNTMEFIIVPDMLLFGRVNAVVALVFVSIVLINAFKLQTHLEKQSNLE